MFGETTIFYVKVWNHPTETTIYKQMFQVPYQQKNIFQPNKIDVFWIVELPVNPFGQFQASSPWIWCRFYLEEPLFFPDF